MLCLVLTIERVNTKHDVLKRASHVRGDLFETELHENEKFDFQSLLYMSNKKTLYILFKNQYLMLLNTIGLKCPYF